MIKDLDQADWERSADDDPNRVADCGCPEQIIADEGHQEGCERACKCDMTPGPDGSTTCYCP